MTKIKVLFVCINLLIFIGACNGQKKNQEQKTISAEAIQKKETAKSTDLGSNIAEKTSQNQLSLLESDDSAKKTTSKPKRKTSTANSSFPIIFYGVPGNDQAFATAKKWGATYVQQYGMGRSIKKDQPYFNLAEKYGLKVMSDLRMRYWLKQKKAIKGLQTYIQHFKNHPALGFWYLSDEPALKKIPVNKLTPFYKMIKKETPNIPVAISHAWATGWNSYGAVQDILMFNSYPIQGGNFPKSGLRSWTAFAKAAIKRGINTKNTTMATLQIFNWKSFAKKGQNKVRGTNIEKLRYPNTQEMRYMIYTPIALGAKGLAFYSYARSKMTNTQWGDSVLAPLIREVKMFENQVNNAKIKHISLGKNGKLLLTLWVNKKSTYMMLVNISQKTQSVHQSLNSELSTGTLKAWKPSYNIKATLKKGLLTIKDVKPWSVLIFKVK